MDKFNFVRDGSSKLPPGFRFQPTDEEIVFQYLARKTFSCPLPASVIPEINIFSFDPWDLPGNSEQDRYFFSNKEPNYRNIGNRSSRATCGGYWKVTGSDKQISCSKRMPIVGIKKTLVFYKGKKPARSDWFMHIYCIALPGKTACHKNINSPGSLIQIGKWVLCHVFFKKGITRKAEVFDNCRLRNYDSHLMTADASDTDSCSASSSTASASDSDSSVLSEVSSTTANSETNTSNVRCT